jgi:predicted nucleic acid-binding protein
VSGLVVLDASAALDLVTRRPDAAWVLGRLTGCEVAAPSHLYSEVLSGLGRRFRAGDHSAADTGEALQLMARMRLDAHHLPGLLLGAWARRDQLRLADALYVELAAQLDTVVITTDRRLARATPLALAPPPEEAPPE